MKINRPIPLAALALVLTGVLAYSATNASPFQRAPAAASRQVNPFEGQTAAIQAGAKLYRRECAACHGSGGSGLVSKAPALASPGVRAASPGVLFRVLRNGAIYRGMPSFSHLPDQQRWQIVTYLKSL